MAKKQSKTVAEALQANHDGLTRAERQLTSSLLENYPISGLGSITSIAERAGVSTPTIVRMVKKLGYKGYSEFQAHLRLELEAKISNPIVKHDSWADNAPDSHILNRFADAVVNNTRQTLSQVSARDFDKTCKLLADTKRNLFIVGGRITHTLADYLFLHMQVMRKSVTHIQSISNAWPHYILDMNKNDVLVIIDVRRYENSTLKLAEMAFERNVTIILITDQWRSPIEKFSNYCFSNHIIVPSAWDSSVTILQLLETFIAAVQELIWPHARERMEDLEDIFDKTRFFRKFS